MTDAAVASVNGPVVVWDNSEENLGFAKGANRGAEEADSELLLFLNNDATLAENWRVMLEPFSDDRVGIVGCRIVYPDGRLQHAGVRLFYDGHGILTAQNINVEQPAGEVMAVTGACMAVRRECFDELGGFDEGFKNGYEDVDLCLRAKKAGWKVWYTPDTTTTHIEAASGPERWKHVQHNIERLHKRWAKRD